MTGGCASLCAGCGGAGSDARRAPRGGGAVRRALRFGDILPPDERAELLKRRSHECYLTDQADEAIGASKAPSSATGSWATGSARGTDFACSPTSSGAPAGEPNRNRRHTRHWTSSSSSLRVVSWRWCAARLPARRERRRHRRSRLGFESDRTCGASRRHGGARRRPHQRRGAELLSGRHEGGEAGAGP